ncbi:hypothetical protein GOODEAATRI_025366 [Goodea atripinnis]|uniref:Secreted protein n=1 Tax=Goodea atripinnis TaxID=208336 RepID=A0ABV0P7Q0_9TELE
MFVSLFMLHQVSKCIQQRQVWKPRTALFTSYSAVVCTKRTVILRICQHIKVDALWEISKALKPLACERLTWVVYCQTCCCLAWEEELFFDLQSTHEADK